MNLKKYISNSTVIIDLKGDSRDSIFKEMLDVLCRAGKIKERDIDTALKALIKREKMMSTGIQDGIAIPHAKINGVKDLIAILGLKRDGIDFESLDGKPSNIFILTLSPEGRPVPHVQFLAEISQRLSNKEVRKRLLSSTTNQEALRNFLELKKKR